MLILSILLYPPFLFLLVGLAIRALLAVGDLLASLAGLNEMPSGSRHSL